MLRKLSRMSLLLVAMLSSEVWGLGLGEVRLNSALNEPLRAEIELLSATPEELANLSISLASPETFERYGLDRPAYLQDIQFRVVRSGRVDGNVVEIRSAAPITEPFLTFIVEAAWARGRLLREYTVLLDPPTFAPPAAAQTTPAVTAPTRTAPADSGRVERTPPPPAPEPARQPAPVQPPQTAQTQPAATPAPSPAPAPAPAPAPVVDDTPYASAEGGDVYVQRGDTLWGITQRVRPDSRLTINQTMLAIFEANRDAFGGNINILRAGASLRIPSADQIFQISRGEAISEVRRQNAAWGGSAVAEPTVADTTRPNLTLVPPDEDFVAEGPADEPTAVDEPLTREQEIEQRITELETADVPVQQSLIEIRNNELAALRQELAEIRGEVYEPPVEAVEPELGLDEPLAEEPPADEIDTDAILAEDPDTAVEATDAGAEEPADVAPPPAQPPARRAAEPSLVDQVLGLLTNFWTILVAALVVVGGVLFWFMRRGRGADDDVDAWQPLDEDEFEEPSDLSGTESLRAPVPTDDSFVVVEQETHEQPTLDDTFEAPVAELPDEGEDVTRLKDPTGQFGSLEDTFSSETAVNLDQSDPIAEADFHMAYGLYDQAADLVNGALQLEPERQDLLTKLCEIYFVWGNRDSFIDAASRLKGVIGDSESADWDKIVIMGQQIASDDELFAGAAVAEATKAVDLSFEGGEEDAGALDMELFAEGADQGDVFDIGTPDAVVAEDAGDGVDFDFDMEAAETQAAPEIDLDATEEAAGMTSPAAEDAVDFDLDLDATEEAAAMASPDADEAVDIDLDLTEEASLSEEEPDFDMTAEMPEMDEGTAEMPAPEPTVETPTIEEQFAGLGATAELPSLDETAEEPAPSGDATAEINLDDLGLDVSGLEETELASLDDIDAAADTGINRALEEELGEATGKNPSVDPNATGVQSTLRADATGFNEALDPEATGVATDTNFDESLLDATGVTQVLGPDAAVETGTDLRADLGDDEATMLAPDYGDSDTAGAIGDDQETLLASLDDDATESDYDFAKTEALPADIFTGNASLDETGELPAVASTDVDLDLDDLTAALQVSDAGDTVEQLRDDATVEQPRPGIAAADDDSAATMSLGPEDMSEDLHEARTMTEVGTKLDLARAYVDMGDPSGARSILEEVLDEGDEGQRQQAQQLLDSLPT